MNPRDFRRAAPYLGTAEASKKFGVWHLMFIIVYYFCETFEAGMLALAAPRTVSEDEPPVLPEEVVAKAVVIFFLDDLEALLLVDMPGGVEDAVGPEYELLVAAAPGKTNALLD